MKKIFFLLFVFAVFFANRQVYAHPPSKITLTYDRETKLLEAIITHPVSDAISHYIKKVRVSINGEVMIEQTMGAQEDNQQQKVAYYIFDVKRSDIISIETICNITGKLSKRVVVE